MIIFLHGEDSFRSKQKLEEIVDQYKKSKKSGFSLIYLDADKIEFQDFYNNFKTSSIFGEKKLIVFKDLFSNKSFQEDFLGEIKKFNDIEDIIIIYESGIVDQRLKVFKALTKECKSQEFNLLSGSSLRLWVQRELEKQKQKINLDAIDLLVSYVSSDLWRMSEEIKKLANFKVGFVIKKDDVELLIKPRIEIDIFKTIDALAQKDKKAALSFLQKHLDNGDNPLYLLSMVSYQFRNLIIVKELAQKGLMYASIVKKSNLHPFVVKKNYFACQKFSLDELKEKYRKVFDIDTDIKRGKLEPETALELLVSMV